MNDRELLELAAKAAGFETIQYKDLKAVALDVRYAIDKAIWNGEDYWNPLVDDGDALRLAVNLELPIRFAPNGTVESGNAKSGYPFWEILDNDPYAATRRAIVRAAAEIGKVKGDEK